MLDEEGGFLTRALEVEVGKLKDKGFEIDG